MHNKKVIFLCWRKQFEIKGQLRDLVKLKKLKNPRKTRIGQTPPTHPHIQF